MWRPSAHNPSTLKLKQEEYHEFTAILGCTVSSSSAWAAELRLCVIKRKQTKKKEVLYSIIKSGQPVIFLLTKKRICLCT